MITCSSTKRLSEKLAPRRGRADRFLAGLCSATWRLCASVTCLLVCADGSAADWPFARGGATSTGVASGTLADEPELLWKYEATESAFDAGPVVAGGVAYLGDGDGTVHAVRIADGQAVWTTQFDETGFLSSGALAKDKLIVGDFNGEVRCLHVEDGALLWTYDTEAEVYAGPIIYEGLALVTTEVGRLHALDLASGEERWRFEIADPLRCSPTVVAGHALLAGCDGNLHTIDLASGNEIGAVGIGGPTGSTVAAVGSSAYFGTESGDFYAVDVADPTAPKVLWTWRDPRRGQGIRTAASVTDSLLVYGSQGKSLYCLDRVKGEPVWQAPQRSSFEASPVVVGQRVVAATTRGRLLIYDLASGDQLWEYDAGGSFVASPVVVDGRLLAASTDGVLYCFGREN